MRRALPLAVGRVALEGQLGVLLGELLERRFSPRRDGRTSAGAARVGQVPGERLGRADVRRHDDQRRDAQRPP